MIDYNSIWQSLNSESAHRPDEGFVWRKVPGVSGLKIFLGSNEATKFRYLFLGYDGVSAAFLDGLPAITGLEADYMLATIGYSTNEPFIRFKQTLPGSDNIAEFFLSDLCEAVKDLIEPDQIKSQVSQIFQDWTGFFSEQSDSLLSKDQQQGLYCELLFLRDYLLNTIPMDLALNSWTGVDSSNHDFQIGQNAIEIKSTSGKAHHKFSISSEKQLDDTGLEKLVLVLLTIQNHSNRPDIGINPLIKSIQEKLSATPGLNFQFNLKLTKVKYDSRLAEKYTIGFSVLETAFYTVSDGFPRIITSDLARGVGDIKYSIMKSACDSFITDTQILKYLL